MTLKEAMKYRHSVRRYKNIPLTSEDTETLNRKIEEINEKSGLSFQLIVNDDNCLSSFAKLFMSKNVKNFILLASDENEKEKVGYYGAELMLYAQTLGLNTWWVGKTFSKKVFDLSKDKYISGIIVIGYGSDQGEEHRSKSPSQVSKYEGKEPDWFKKGVEGTLLAPTAFNYQNFVILGADNKAKIICEETEFKDVNSGILKYYFELSSGKKGILE